MSSILQPFGLKPVENTTGLSRPANFAATSYVGGTVQKNYNTATTFAKYQPVQINSGGQLDAAASVAATSTPIWGLFLGATYIDSSGRKIESNWFRDSFITTVADPQVIFWVATDIYNTEFEIQSENSIASSAVNTQYNFSVAAGRTPSTVVTIGTESAFCPVALGAAVATTVQGQVRVIGLGREVAYPSSSAANAFGDAFTIVRCVIANTAITGPKAAL